RKPARIVVLHTGPATEEGDLDTQCVGALVAQPTGDVPPFRQSIRMRTVVSGEAQCCWRARTEGRQGRASAAETQHRAQPTAPRPGRLLRSVAIHCIQSNAASSSLGQTGCSQMSRNLVCARRVRALEPCRFPETFPLKMTIWNCNAKALLLRVRMRRGNLGTL